MDVKIVKQLMHPNLFALLLYILFHSHESQLFTIWKFVQVYDFHEMKFLP